MPGVSGKISIFRLSVVRLRVPALRERREDIARLAQEFAAQLGQGTLPSSVIHELESRLFRGNVRELRNAIQSYTVFGVLPSACPYDDGNVNDLTQVAEALIDPTRPYSEQKERVVQWFQALYFRRVLSLANGNKSRAARLACVERSYLSKIVRTFSGDV